jgi:putative phage-type endonuclease
MAKLVLGSDAGREAWLEHRRTGITASEIAIILGLVPGQWGSPLALYLTKRGEIGEDDRDDDAMALGRYLEDFVCQRFAEQHPEMVVAGDGLTLWAHAEHPWMLATPDRLVFDDEHGYSEWGDSLTAVLEAKTSNSKDEWGDGGTDEIPVRYRCQVLWQMHVMGVERAWVACLFLQSRTVRSYEVTLDAAAEADIELMIAAAEEFLRRIAEGDPPDVDWTEATSHALKQLHPDIVDREVTIPVRLATRYRRAHASLNLAKERYKLAENEIRQRLGNGRVVSDPAGNVVATRQRYDVPARVIPHRAYAVDKLIMKREGEENGS